jgi:hypothetical protein
MPCATRHRVSSALLRIVLPRCVPGLFQAIEEEGFVRGPRLLWPPPTELHENSVCSARSMAGATLAFEAEDVFGLWTRDVPIIGCDLLMRKRPKADSAPDLPGDVLAMVLPFVPTFSRSHYANLARLMGDSPGSSKCRPHRDLVFSRPERSATLTAPHRLRTHVGPCRVNCSASCMARVITNQIQFGPTPVE